jgi:hypothetical protein
MLINFWHSDYIFPMIVILGIKRCRVCGTMYSFLEEQNLLLLNNRVYTQVLDGAVLLSTWGDIGSLTRFFGQLM